MGELYKGYVETHGKKCAEKFKNRTDFKTLEEVQSLPEYAGILEKDTMFIDIDDSEQAEKMMNIVEALQLNCRVICTRRGKHFIFKNSQIKNCKTHCKLAIGLTADIKVGFVASYEVLKVDGEERFCEWDKEPGAKYQEVPKWFFPVRSKMDFLDMEAGDGRNQELFNYILTLQSNDFSVEETRETIRLINKYVLKDPLSDQEIETILRDDAFKKPVFFNGGKFLFDRFAAYMKNTSHIVTINGNLHIYNDGVYLAGYKPIEAEMIKVIPDLSDAKRKEVLKYLTLICDHAEPADARYIAFRNGIYDIVTDTMQDFSPNVIITNKIPWDYNGEAFNELTDKTLNKLSCGDPQIRALLEECIGYVFYRRNFLNKAFILIGDKANGKSTFLKVLTAIIGSVNASALDLKNLNDRFSKASLFGKLANIGDDISDEFIPDASLFKKITDGGRIEAEHKGQDPFDFAPYAKLIFSVNNMPRIRDKTGAVLRRLVIIPFNAEFSKDDPEFNPRIVDELIEQSSIEYCIKVGLDGLRRLLDHKRFSESDKVDREISDYEDYNNPARGFIKEMRELHGGNYPLNENPTDVYTAYKVYCSENGYIAESQIAFGKTLRTSFRVESWTKNVRGKRVRLYRTVTD